MDVSNYLRYKSCGSWPRQTNKKLRWSCTVTVNLYQVNSQCWPVRPVLLIYWSTIRTCRHGVREVLVRSPGGVPHYSGWWDTDHLFHGSMWSIIIIILGTTSSQHHSSCCCAWYLVVTPRGGIIHILFTLNCIITILNMDWFRLDLYKWCDGNLSLTNAVEALYFVHHTL